MAFQRLLPMIVMVTVLSPCHCDDYPCYTITCKNGGCCLVHSAKTTYRCDCPPEFTGRTCEEKVTPCHAITCKNGGTCLLNPTNNSAHCSCTQNFTGLFCEAKEFVDSAKLDDVIKPLLKEEGQTNKCSPPKFKDYSDIIKYKTESGVYDIAIGNSSKKVFCDMITSGGGWTVIQKRSSKSVSFDRGWTEYEQGFGDAKGDYWLGNKFMHQLTSGATYKLRIDLWGIQSKHKYAEYKTFVVGDSASKNKLTIAGYTGTAGDAMKDNNGMKFTTMDQDNDLYPSLNCAKIEMGAWWSNACGLTGLNANMIFGIFWGDIKYKTVMMIKRK